MNNGFAINNVSLGVGSFSMQCLEHWEANPLDNSGLVQSVQYAPFTRDTFGIAVKATYAKDIDGKSIMIFKNLNGVVVECPRMVMSIPMKMG